MSSDRLAVITGASGGIGAACVRLFRERGHRVLGVDREPASSADEHAVVDLSASDCGEAVAAAVAGRGVAALVNNAAIAVYADADETSPDTWDTVLAINLRAPFLVSRALHHALARARGNVVNVASVHAEATSPKVTAYAASKGGLQALTRALALEWADEGIRVNCVLPGAVDTAMLRAGLFRSEATVESLAARHPLGRVGDPEDIAEAILFLAGEGASFITGASLRIDGGATARLSTE